MKYVKTRIKSLLAKHSLLDYLLKYSYINLHRIFFLCRFSHKACVENSFLFECFKGNMVNDSPLAIYKVLLKNNSSAKFIWVLSSSSHPMYSTLKENNNTSIVIYGSYKYFLAYATANYWIVNCRIPYQVMKKRCQVFVQCWHGTPLKKIGADIKIGANVKASQKTVKYAYSLEAKQIDYFLSPSPYASKCFISSFGLNEKQILELGYPRNDELFTGINDTELINNLKLTLGIPTGKKVILYGPTFRDNYFCEKKQSHILFNSLDNDEFLSALGDEFVFLYRGHYFSKLENDFSKFLDMSSYNNINDLFLVSDLLITDYSSLFFDYSLLNKPSLFFMYDRTEYESKTRGFYFDIDKELPGKISALPSVLVSDIFNALNKPHQLSGFNTKFNPHEDGFSAQRVVDAIVKKRNINANL